MNFPFLSHVVPPPVYTAVAPFLIAYEFDVSLFCFRPLVYLRSVLLSPSVVSLSLSVPLCCVFSCVSRLGILRFSCLFFSSFISLFLVFVFSSVFIASLFVCCFVTFIFCLVLFVCFFSVTLKLIFVSYTSWVGVLLLGFCFLTPTGRH